MRLTRARVQDYRSVVDSGWFDVENLKTILVGPNEAGKSALLQALQQINPPPGVPNFDALRDYPRAKYNDIDTKKVDPAGLTVVEAHFALEDSDKSVLPPGFPDCVYQRGRRLDNTAWHRLEGAPVVPTFGGLKKDLARMGAHVDARIPEAAEGAVKVDLPSVALAALVKDWTDATKIEDASATDLRAWLDQIVALIDDANEVEEERHENLVAATHVADRVRSALAGVAKRLPVFVLFNNYFRVRPSIHLQHLAQRIETKIMDDEQYDYGNHCLLKLLGFTARELSDLGKAAEPAPGDAAALKTYRDQLDKRRYKLNAASVRLTQEICQVWSPDAKRDEADRLDVQADSQYLKVVVQDDQGVEIELDQRSEGFQWLVSFFVVFFAEAADKHERAILLLDEPGLSLHGLKQREFRKTISKLAEKNQTLYTTHSPFLVGPDELDLVRVVEMTDRRVGTKVHTVVASGDPAGLLPLQEALGYDLAQSLFAKQRNLVHEGLTDSWYVDGTVQLLREAGVVDLDEKIALVIAGDAGKVVYYATILHAHSLKVAALLDSDAAGDQAAKQEALIHALGNKNILRTKDAYVGAVQHPEIEDLLRDTLVQVAKTDLGWDVEMTAQAQPARPIADLFAAEIKDFSKYRLAKAYLRWTRSHEAKDLTPHEREQWTSLINKIGRALK